MKNITNLEIGNERILDSKTETIRFEGTNTDLFWRIYGDAINPNCEIIVPPTHQAVFIKDGELQNILEPGKHRVFEVTSKGFLGIGKKVEKCVVDIIFMNRTIKFNVLWGTHNPIQTRDVITQIPCTLRGNGEFEVRIDNPQKFYLEIVGAEKNFTIESLKSRLQVKMLSYIEPAIAKVLKEKIISYVDIPQFKREISDSICPVVNELFIKDCGLTVDSFTIDYLGIDDEEIFAIESQLKQEREELKNKRDAKEIAAELERLDDKAWERQLILKQLELADREKFYEVQKILAANPSKSSKGQFCPDCGTPFNAGMKFCSGCGKPLPGGKAHCPECGTELESTEKFCHNCGHKMR